VGFVVVLWPCAVDWATSRREGAGSVRILVLGAGVIGSVYAGRLLQAGHEVVLMARGARLADLHEHGLILQNAESGDRREIPALAVREPNSDDHFDLVLVPVRAEQLESTLPALTAMTDGSDVLFFGNTANRQAQLVAALGKRALFGFPAAGGTRNGPVITFVLITQQKTIVGEPDGITTPRVRQLQRMLNGAGFPTMISTNIDGWLLGHAAFVVPIAFALYRVDVDAPRLAADRATMRLMVSGTREAFTALHSAGNTEIPRNLRILYRMPTVFVTAYWRRVLASPRGELWFAAHSRAAREEMHALAQHLQQAVRGTGHPTPDLDRLLAVPA
jgi:2-dehydropantoate 2-reductase